ncbi:MAG TPA: DUF1206 domain-containing protein, partial [Catenuloplanes sp.]
MTTARQLGHDAEAAVRQTTHHRHVQFLGRGGLAAYGLVHFTIAYLAARIAFGAGSAKADKAGALATFAAQTGGRALLWAVTVGLAMLVVWRVGEATVGLRWVQPKTKRRRKRIENAATAIVFAVLAISAGKLASGAGAGTDDRQEEFTARVLALPFGQLLVGAAGAALIAFGSVLAYRGVHKKFLADLDLSTASPTARKVAVRLGQAGYPAVGATYAIIGLLIAAMAATFNPKKAVGLDAALTTLAARPY